MGGGFLWGAFAHAFLCLTVVFTQQPQPTSPPSTSRCRRQSYLGSSISRVSVYANLY